jgi:hypothetical protein
MSFSGKSLVLFNKIFTLLWFFFNIFSGDAEEVARLLGEDVTFDHSVLWLLGMDRGKFAKLRNAGK